MSKTTVTIVAVTSGVLFFLYLYGMSKLGNNKDLSISNYNLDTYFDTKVRSDNIPLFISDDESGQEEIMGGSRKRKNKQKKGKRKRTSKKYFKNNQ